MKKAFTYIELMLVVAIIGLLAALLVPHIVRTSSDKHHGDKTMSNVSSSADASNARNAQLTAVDRISLTDHAVEIYTNVSQDGVVNYGSGVYYFPKTEADFGNSLAKFLSAHTNLEVTAMTGNVVRQNNSERGGTYDYGAAVGYFVTTREKVPK